MAFPTILGVHSSSPSLGAALVKDGQLVSEITLPPDKEHLEKLPGLISLLVSGTGLDFNEIDALAVALGPGSFSGIRVGLSMVKGMAAALNKPVIGISSLEILAFQGLTNGDSCACLIDAKRGEFYFAAYKSQDSGIGLLDGPKLIRYDLLREHMHSISGSLNLCMDTVPSGFSAEPWSVAAKHYSSAAGCALLAAEKLRTESPNDPNLLVPIYVRRSDAEEKRASK